MIFFFNKMRDFGNHIIERQLQQVQNNNTNTLWSTYKFNTIIPRKKYEHTDLIIQNLKRLRKNHTNNFEKNFLALKQKQQLLKSSFLNATAKIKVFNNLVIEIISTIQY
eukprot:TRINITY_DN45125_c0_g1_i1.p2 TRINITY_DN45125_c0_g1~~TRINITY_DN45125_c0_g1_i1.p2  ORF type:complete len:109 (+),score=0.19 TRINITY_DN45125_c0_g1_i1:225-551(+)